MQPILSRIDPRDPTFQHNVQANLLGVKQLHKHLDKAIAGGGERYTQRHLQRGKLLPRQRIDLLLDRDSPFLELCALAGLHEKGQVPGGAAVSGIGRVEGVECLITASEATVQGGAIGAIGVRKAARLSQIAEQNRLPSVQLIESAGADLPNQADIFVPGGQGFRDITRRSRDRLPTISLVFGSSTAGGAYIPGMSDYTVMVKEAAYMYLAGPPLVKMATGEIVDDETLGGADLHSKRSGVSDFLAQDEADAIRIGRELVGRLGWRKEGPAPTGPADEPLYDPHELLGIASADLKVPFEVREVLARIVDGSRFLEFKPLYGSTLVCGWAEISGYRVGILGNNGVLFSESAEKGAQFIQLCNQTDTPLLFLQNITGFMVGADAEARGIIKAGSKLINAVSNSTVPAITLMVGGSYGAGNYAMMGRAYEPRFLFTWPNHKIAVMGAEQLAGVIDLVKRQAAAKKGVPVNEEQLTMMKQMLAGKIENESSCWQATGRLFDDGVIDPRDTRTVLSLALSAVHSAPVSGTSAWGTFRH
ncbi:MAG: acyl-CoA carboxylase subunit beta [Deltaproteobacteria bacterium]|nr:MAG: acyl-CoA carboxylase subunit beta [Deltaproteobacteria bacterium]